MMWSVDVMADQQRDGMMSPLKYMPQLDGLRALAVGLVIVQHFEILNGGAVYGVHLFFVLSGFLITGILLAGRQAAETRGSGWAHALRQFYIRRVLRIFPLYYLVVLVGIAANANYAREFAPWLLSYTINLKMATQGWFIDNFAHFWSLAVEEQYYLIWPWLILLLPRRWLARAALIMTASGPLFRLYLLAGWTYWGSQASGLQSYIATPTALDSLGIGSLIAIVMSSESGRQRLRSWMQFAIPAIALVVAIVLSIWFEGLGFVLFDTVTATLFGWLIYTASFGFGGIAGRLLGASPLVFLGKISYGLYVYHALVPAAAARLASAFGFPLPSGVGPRFVAYTALTLAVSAISWYSFERPINSLKRKFAYAAGERIEPA